MKRFVVQIAVLPVLAGAFVGAQQPSPPPNDPGLLFRVTTRMVLVDAIVLDKEGNPVQDLKANDFTVTEDGVRQRITSFAERIPEPARPAPPPVLPPHVTTNRPFFFFPAEDGIRDLYVTGVQTCALPIFRLLDAVRSELRLRTDLARRVLGQR